MSDTILSRLRAPQGVVDAVLDTDTFNEIDDQFALSYMLRSTERINTRAIYAAPFFNENSSSPEDGMLKSYEEIKTLLKLANREDLIPCAFEGSRLDSDPREIAQWTPLVAASRTMMANERERAFLIPKIFSPRNI